MDSLFGRIFKLQHLNGPKCPKCGSDRAKWKGYGTQKWFPGKDTESVFKGFDSLTRIDLSKAVLKHSSQNMLAELSVTVQEIVLPQCSSPYSIAGGWYDASGNHLGWNVRNPGRPVGPAHTAGPYRRYILAGIDHKRARYRFLYGQLGQAQHDAQDDDAAQHIGQYGSRAGILQHITSAEEIPAAYDSAQ